MSVEGIALVYCNYLISNPLTTTFFLLLQEILVNGLQVLNREVRNSEIVTWSHDFIQVCIKGIVVT